MYRFLPLSIVLALEIGCGSPPVPFAIQLVLDEDCGALTDCEDHGMACGASLGLRILDAEAMVAPDGGRSSPELFTTCVEIDPDDSPTLCDLDTVAIDFPEVPTRMVQIQVALWNPADLDDPLDCPIDIFDLQGVPLPVLPQPAFGGASYFAVGSGEVARVSLSCRDPGQLNAAECLPETQRVTATLDDMNTGVVVTYDHAADLDVSVGEPHQPTEDEWVLEPSDTSPLELAPMGSSPYWIGTDVPGFDATACLLALDKSVAQSVTAVTCTDEITPKPNGSLSLSGWVLPKEVLDQILAAAGLSDFPDQGLVVGRVVDDVGSPLAGVVVSASSATIEYLSADRTSADGTETSTDAFFIARDAEYNTRFTAIQPADGREEAGEYRAGLIVGRVSVVTIKMGKLIAPTAR